VTVGRPRGHRLPGGSHRTEPTGSNVPGGHEQQLDIRVRVALGERREVHVFADLDAAAHWTVDDEESAARKDVNDSRPAVHAAKVTRPATGALLRKESRSTGTGAIQAKNQNGFTPWLNHTISALIKKAIAQLATL
jgi:hypothetical protein